jgi:hypothetical protein
VNEEYERLFGNDLLQKIQVKTFGLRFAFISYVSASEFRFNLLLKGNK